jgi:hypothetical protein
VNRQDLWARLRAYLRHWSWIDAAAYVLILAGLFLGQSYHVGFLALVAVGAFLPGLLREVNVLADRDELQRHAAANAGHRAFLVGGLLLVTIMIALGWGQPQPTPDQGPLLIVLLFMLVVYLFSYAFSFWDARRAARRVLLAFGLFWLAFVVLSHALEPAALLLEGLLVPLPFLLGAWLAGRWPRLVGVVLLGMSVFALFFFNIAQRAATDESSLLTALLLPLPLAVVGLALLGSRGEATAG